MAKKFKLIGFDLDGTLVDSLPDLALSLNSAFAEVGLPTAPEALVLTWIGNGADVLFAKGLNGQGEPTNFPRRNRPTQAPLRAFLRRKHLQYQQVISQRQIHP